MKTVLLCVSLVPMIQGYKFIDLSHAQNPDTLYWAGVPTFTRAIVAAGTNAEGVWIEVGQYSTGEHGGTHIDVPRHFIKDGYDLKDMPIERTVADGVNIDCVAEAANDVEYGVTKEKIEQWERDHGRIPDQAAVLFRFGYAEKFWYPEQYLNTQDTKNASTYRFPYVTLEAARWLVDNRNLKMIGMDVPSPDAATDYTYPVHLLLLKDDIIIMENVNIQNSLPPRDFRVHASPIRIENGTGTPTRIYAMLYERMNDGAASLSPYSSLFSLVYLSFVAALVNYLRQ